MIFQGIQALGLVLQQRFHHSIPLTVGCHQISKIKTYHHIYILIHRCAWQC